MIRRIVFALIILFALAGCGPKEGLVVDKHYKPDLSYWGTQTSCSGTGRNQSCVTGPHWYYNPPVYTLVLQTPDGKIKNKDVKKQIYYTIKIGDYYKEK